MEAGRKLDELVSEKVMGWKRTATGWVDEGTGKETALKPFSTDLTTAWTLAERIFELERGFRLQIEGSKTWRARFYKSVAMTLETREFSATGSTPAEAICLAALAVRGVSA